MKKKWLMAMAFAVCCTAGVFGDDVSSSNAMEAARGWINLKEALGEEFSAEPESVQAYEANGGTGTYYVVSLAGGGFVVTSGDTTMEPILAYSKEGVWNTNAAENPLMTMLNIDVAVTTAGLKEQNSAVNAGGGLRLAAGAGGDATASAQQQAAAAKWARLRAAANAKGGQRLRASAPSDLRVNYLVQSKWGQSGHGENYYTPGSYVCGCVATMGAQTMRYWSWPDSSVTVTAAGDFYADVVYSGGTKGWNISGGYYSSASASSKTAWSPAFGSAGGAYNWSYMKLNPSSSDGGTYKAAIGKLTRDVGLACYMTYNINNSGASSSPGSIFGHRMVDTFGYANAKITYGWNDASKAAMLASFDAGIPCPTIVPAHAIVADGYGYDGSGTLFVHFNFGWTGSSDAWYTPPDLSSVNSKFTSLQAIIYNAYPPSKGAPDLTVVSGRVLNNGSAVGGVTVKAENRETGTSYTATSSSGGSFGKGVYALMLPAGNYTITASSGSNSIKVFQRVNSCVSDIFGGSGSRSFAGTPANIHGFDLNLTSGGSTTVTRSLAHRWSFNGNLNDSVGGSTATKIGSAVTVADGKAKLTGSGNGAGSLNLGQNLLNTDAATIEIWASQTAARNWARVFDYGVDNTHYFCLTWSQGGDAERDRAGCKNTTEVAVDNTMAPYKLGRQFHISATFEKQGDGTTFVRWMRRDAATGALQKSGTMTVPNGIQSISNPVLYLGHSFYTSDSDACAEYDEVRIWNGVLSDAQLSANANAGPDNLEPPPNTTRIMTAKWKGGTTAPTAASLANTANWTCYDQSGNTVANSLPNADTTVVIPAGNTAFSIPAGYTPNWRKVQFGEGKTATFWGKKACGSSGSSAFKDAKMTDYALQGQGSVSALHGGIIHNPSMNTPADTLASSQLRYDGWFYVTSAQAGNWTLHAFVDDYVGFQIDDEWAVFGLSCQQGYASIDVKPGWHKYRLIVGDTGGGYGGRILASNHKTFTPLAIKINGAGEYAFSPENFTFGSGTETVKLNADCDLSALGDVVLDSGATIDLNGHRLKVQSIAGDNLNAKVTSSASGAKLVCTSGANTVNTNNLTVASGITIVGDDVATPVISPSTVPDDTTFFSGSKTVTITCATSGATIRYTMDGSEPTASSAQYSKALTISATTTVKAKAFKANFNDSETATVYYSRLTETDNLILNGDFEQSWLIDTGNRWAYAEDIGTRATVPHWTVNEKAGLAMPNTTWCADIAEFGTYAIFLQHRDGGGCYIEQKFKVPLAGLHRIEFDYTARPSYVGATSEIQFAEGNGAFTTLGTIAPTTTGRSTYTGTVSVSAAGVCTLRINQPGKSEDKGNIVDNFSFKFAETVATPTISPASGSTFYVDSTNVTLVCATAGATIRYTLDGSEPTESSTAYSAPFALTTEATVKAKAFKTGYAESLTASATIAVKGRVATPVASPAAMTFFDVPTSVTLSCATAGATIRYTTDGSAPTASSPEYSSVISISDTTTINAKAFITAGGVTYESDVLTATYTLAEQAAAPTSTSTAGYRNTLVDLASTVSGATIRYTTDGSDPTVDSDIYTPGTTIINITDRTGPTTIKAQVFADGYRPSEVFTYDYYVKEFFGPTNGPNAAVWEDTPQNRADYWIFENEDYKEATGLWSDSVEYVNGKVTIDERNEFTADNPATGKTVIIETTASFNSAAEEFQDFDGVKAAVRIGTNSCFQVFTTNASGRVWLDTEGASAEIKHDYTVRLELNCTNKTYKVSINNGTSYVPLTIDGRPNFPFAYANDNPVQVVGYAGEGSVGSISGSYTNKADVTYANAEEFINGESKFWLDASATDTITTNANGEVTQWNSRVGSNAASTHSGFTYPAYDTATYGFPTVDFGAVGSKKDLGFTAITDIRTVFMVVKIAQDQNAFWLGDTSTHNFHRGVNGQYAESTYGHSNIAKIWNDLEPKAKTDVPPADKFIVVSMEMNGPSTSDSLTADRPASTADRPASVDNCNGGKQLSELIVFSYFLSDEERIAVTEYLQAKWPSGKVAMPTSPTETKFFTDTHSVTLECATDGATIYYTLDGSEPTDTNTVYSAPFDITGTTTVRAIACAADYTPSEIFTQTFTLAEKVATPTSPTETTFFANTHSITLECATDGATIYYTLDGSEPTDTNTVYSAPFDITATTTVKARAFMDGYRGSDTFTQTFTLTGTVEPPTFSPDAPLTFFDIPQLVTLSCATANATIRYTLDGSEPTASSTVYTGAISLSDTTTIKAKAFVTFTGGTFESATASAAYTLAPQAEQVTGSCTSDYRSGSVSLSSDIQGATIYYTTDGTTPTTNSTVYTGSFVFDGNNTTGTIMAVVYADGYRPSDVFTIDYSVKQFFGDTTGDNPAAYEDTPQNRADHWVQENEEYKEATGLWSNAVEYVNHKVNIEEQNEFVVDNLSDGRNVTIETTISSSSVSEDHEDYDNAKAAVRLGTNNCFQVYTRNDEGTVWLDTQNFVATPNPDQDYTLKLELDMTNKTYTVEAKRESDANYTLLTAGGKSSFKFAFSETSPYVQTVSFYGEGSVSSIYGSYTNKVVEFVADEVITGSDGTTTLTADQADWLNKRGDHAAVATAVGKLTSDQFEEAYLLNEDIMDADYLVTGWGTFEISDIEVGEEEIAVKVKLVRNFALKDGEKEAPIKGALKLYGGENVRDVNSQITVYELNDNDEHFRDGQEATYIIKKTTIKFFKAKIE